MIGGPAAISVLLLIPIALVPPTAGEASTPCVPGVFALASCSFVTQSLVGGRYEYDTIIIPSGVEIQPIAAFILEANTIVVGGTIIGGVGEDGNGHDIVLSARDLLVVEGNIIAAQGISRDIAASLHEALPGGRGGGSLSTCRVASSLSQEF